MNRTARTVAGLLAAGLALLAGPAAASPVAPATGGPGGPGTDVPAEPASAEPASAGPLVASPVPAGPSMPDASSRAAAAAETGIPSTAGSASASATGNTSGERRPARVRRFMLGIEGLGLQVPALRPRITALDARYLGNSVTLGGVGLFGRWQVVPLVSLELGVRSGSLRYRSQGDVISQDMVLAEAGALLYLVRGAVGHLALDGGAGGLMHAIRYELQGRPDGSQIVAAAVIHVGADLELRLRRLAFTASLRAYGVISDVARTRTRGALFDGVSEALRRAPVAVYQTYLLGSVGIAYRF